MPLTFSGEREGSQEFETLLEAFDGEKRVVIVTSSEAIEDHGLHAVQSRAEEKYDAGLFGSDGRVRVLTTDF
ncbi:hypothetical protein [Leisingera methylohalidivorans]|uniref:Uncharacterized protein n=1 Tax=Leisingera methylohalidivorans DSM 14336 TaxID=999552 RepID=V9VZC7_9RHOB|nr:hypothetical protein [Leisingera methylohalidivorans]AHD03273.1 hypothetical protein METH_18015 [Leisingera methylohalidivorans DSM 14336]